MAKRAAAKTTKQTTTKPAAAHRAARAAGTAPASSQATAPRREPVREAVDVGRRTLRVRATQMGYYNHARRRPGNVFTLTSAAHFSTKWMEWVSPATPELTTSGQREIDRAHDEKVGGKVTRVEATAASDGHDEDEDSIL